ncbi:MAG TPA: alpha-L-arabinofuranosidase C-terminal domain-containing protein, partial [Verrucomicrobiae bacterium]|nr:alpha-L-arabinofuranosidase C-terminal domain-containing protein [Verrucomicrobiae bacterium]
HDVAKPRETIRKLYASATRESKTGDIILKVVNTATNPASVEITLRGATNLSGSGKAIVLTSDSRRDENSIEEPLKVSPKTETFSFQDGHFSRAFPGNSVSVLRIAEK